MTAASYHGLVAIDDSDPAENAVSFVRERFSGDRITLLHVVPTGMPATDTRVFQEAAERDKMESMLTEYESMFDHQQIDVETVTIEGTPDREIVDYAVNNDIDQIFIGSHGRRGLDRLLLGSVAEKVVRRSPLPVTVVR